MTNVTNKLAEAEKLIESEQRLRTTFDRMLEGIQIHDFNWRYIYVNDALVKYSTYTRKELLGYTLMEKYPGIEQSSLFQVMNRCMTERTTEHLETEFVFPDGSKADFELSIQPIPEGVFILSIDITERKKAVKEIEELNKSLERKVTERTAELEAANKKLESNVRQLEESEEKFQKAFHASAAGITITRLSDSVYVEVNDAFSRMTGFSIEELQGNTSIALGLVVNKEKREKVFDELAIHGFTKDVELSVRHKSGKILNVLTSMETVLLKGEKYAINIIYDITERKKAEEQLAFANKELEAFSYSVSHDLRAPLRGIHNYSRILEEEYYDKLDEEGKKIIGVILRNSKKMGILIDDLLAFSRLGRKEVRRSVIDMNALTRAVVDEVLSSSSDVNVAFDIGDLPATNGDESLIRQVLLNLVSNAVKYSAKTPHPSIQVGFDKNSYYVKDNGAGFDMAYYDKLFGVFQRLHSEEDFEGTGVGLAIVKRIIEKHEGKVWAESRVEQGATFYFSLP